MDVKSGYKQTEVGIIPEEWDVRCLTTLLEQPRSVRYGIVQPGKHDHRGCLMLRSQDYSKGWTLPDEMHRVNSQLEQQYRNARIHRGDLIMTVVGAGIGQVVTAPDWLDGAILSRSTARIAVDESQASREFVKALLESPVGKRQIRDCQKEGAQPVLSCRDLAKFFIPYPSPSEQCAIAEALNDLDGLLDGLDRLITKKRDLRQAAMQQLLTGQTRLPGFRGEWEVKSLGQLANLYQPQTISAKQFTETGVPVYGANGVVGFYHSANHHTWQVTVTCRGSTCGTVNRTAEECWITGNAMVLNCDANGVLDKEFFYYLLLSQDLSGCITGTGQPQIIRSALQTLTVTLPKDVLEQRAIAGVLSDMDAELNAMKELRDKTRNLKQAMMQELLTGKTRLV